MNEPEYKMDEVIVPEEPDDDAGEWKNRYIRLRADMDNMRKRMAKENESTINFAIQNFALELLPAKDAMERGIETADIAVGIDPVALVEGVHLTLSLLNKAFSDAGIEEINPLDQPFNPELHEALTVRKVPDTEPQHHVLTVFEKGYVLNGRLLRPAKVEVSIE